MKIITKAQLISQFGERNANIMWQRHVTHVAGHQAILDMLTDAKERRGTRRLVARKEHMVLTPPSAPQGTFEERLTKIATQFMSGERKVGDAIHMALPHNLKDGE